MLRTIIIIIIILILITILYKLYKLCIKQEHFDTSGGRHAKLDDWDSVMYVDNQPPPWRGDQSCFKYPCPSVFEKDIKCWKCFWRESEPQNE